MKPVEETYVKAGFWWRLVATWIDLFIIYAITVSLIELTAVIRVRISFEPLYITLGAIYGTMWLTYKGQTVGKMLLGIIVTTKLEKQPSLKDVLLREVLGKWGIAITVPIVIGRVLVGQAWVPTVYDGLVLLPWLLLLFFHYLITRRTWYDLLAGTVVKKSSGYLGFMRPVFLSLIGAAVLGLGTKVTEFTILGWLPCRLALFYSMRSSAPYTVFLKRGHAKPLDYIIGLFDRYDVVVLCERPHPEASQWDFIYELLRDQRFIDRIGHVFTEYGQVGMQSYLDDFMATDGLSTDEIHERVVHIMRNWAVWPIWTNTNFYTYLTRLYQLNQSLPHAKRIHHHFTDVSVNWHDLSDEGYRAYRHSLINRDEQMARIVIEKMTRLAESSTSTPPKCLVVMNYRHAFDLTGGSSEAQRRNTYEFLKVAFEDRTANVLLNTNILLFVPIAGGVWDTAFKETGNRPAGFDFEDSPFGYDPFDMFPFFPGLKGRLKYREVFKGFVFTHPLDNQYLEHGIPGYYDGFEKEALRRAKFVSDDYYRGIETIITRKNKESIATKHELPNHLIQSLLELSMLTVTGMGMLVGLGVSALNWRSRDEQ